MKKIKITESQYKRLIIEQSSDQECIDQLQDETGVKYKVSSISGYEQNVVTCKAEPNIDCILTLLNNNNVPNNRMVIKQISGSGCLITVMGNKAAPSTSVGGRIWYLTFWDDKSLTCTTTLQSGIKNPTDKKTYTKVMYEGSFNCDGTYKNLTYSASIENGSANKVNGVKFALVGLSPKSDGTLWQNNELLERLSIPEDGQLINLLNKTTER